MRLERATSQLLLIDLQERLLPAIDGGAAVVGNVCRLAASALRLDVPVTVTEQYPKGLGATIEPVRRALGNSGSVLAKTEFSGMANAAIGAHLGGLRQAGRGQIVVAGVEAHVCVAQTALDLVTEGFGVFVVETATGSRTATSKALAMARLRQAGAVIVDHEMVLFEWLGSADASEFKDVQALIK